MSGISVRLILLALAAGHLLPLLLFTRLPGAGWIWLGALPLLVAALTWRRRLFWPLLAGVVSLQLACMQHQQLLDQRLPAELDSQRLVIEGVVAELPEATVNGWRFRLAGVSAAEAGNLPDLRVHWYAGEAVLPGQRWRFQARLRLPAGMSNPGGFDYESWLYAQGIGGLASVSRGELLAQG